MIDWISTNVPPWLWITLVVHGVVLGTVAYLILLERKVASWVQDRIGPNRVGPLGLLQPLADGLKFIFKEDYRPKNVDRVLFTVAPALMILVVIVSIAVIPWGGTKASQVTTDVTAAAVAHAGDSLLAGRAEMDSVVESLPSGHVLLSTPSFSQSNNTVSATYFYGYPFQVASLNIGVLFVVAVLSLAVYGVVVGGWASNNKYSFLGGLRATANMISYEIPLGLSILSIVIVFHTLDLGVIVDKQAHYWAGFMPAWNIFCQPLAFVLFLICIHAEANRAPFDIAEAEQELVGGYHTEYSSMRFALFFLAEYAGMITTSAVCVALFFGGWHLPWIEWAFPSLRGDIDPGHPAWTSSFIACVVRSGVFFVKTLAIIFIFMWNRWSLPRFRFDQIMMLAWRALIPMSLAMMVGTTLVIYFWGTGQREYGRVNGLLGLFLLAMNVIVMGLSLVVSRIIPAAPATNRRMAITDSRFKRAHSIPRPTAIPLAAPAATN